MAFPVRNNGGGGGSDFDPSLIPPIVRSTDLVGLVSLNEKINASDSVLAAFGKSKGQIDGIFDSVGKPNGFINLDDMGLIATKFLPSSIFKFQGYWTPSTNIPPLTPNDPLLLGGEVYQCDSEGSHDFGQGSIHFNKGDLIVYALASSTWIKNISSNEVLSVQNKTGHVTLYGDMISVSEDDDRKLSELHDAAGTVISTTKKISKNGDQVSVDFAGIRWGFEYSTQTGGKQFYQSVGTEKQVYYSQKAFYDGGIEGRARDGIVLPLSVTYYDTLMLTQSREITFILVHIDDQLWRVTLFVSGLSVQLVSVSAERLS